MQILECPHCATRVANDATYSEMVVTCPGCRQLFQMPVFTPAPTSSAPAGVQSSPSFDLSKGRASNEQSGEQPIPARRRREGRQGPPLWLAVVGSTAVFWVAVFLFVWGSGINLFGRSKPSKGNQGEKGSLRPVEDKPSRPGK